MLSLGYAFMKERIFIISVVVLLVAGSFSTLLAVPIGSSNLGREYYTGVSDLDQWSCGFYYNLRDRHIRAAGQQYLMKSRKLAGYVGYDFKPWFTTYGMLGSNETEIEPTVTSGASSEYGFGMIFNLLDQEILAPTLFEDRIRVNAALQYTKTKAVWVGRSTKWRELFASLIISIVNDLDGNRLYLPISISLFGGPIYSNMTSSSFNESDSLGFTAGLEVFFTDKVSFYVGTERFDSDAFMTGVNVRF